MFFDIQKIVLTRKRKGAKSPARHVTLMMMTKKKKSEVKVVKKRLDNDDKTSSTALGVTDPSDVTA